MFYVVEFLIVTFCGLFPYLIVVCILAFPIISCVPRYARMIGKLKRFSCSKWLKELIIARCMSTENCSKPLSAPESS